MKINPEIFKSYDIRGLYPQEINEEAVYFIGKALAVFFDCEKIVIGRDMRDSSKVFFESLSKGLIEAGVDVIDIGLVSTEVLYFSVGYYNLPGVMITASHLRGEYNGLKICRNNLMPLGAKSSLDRIKKIILNEEFKSSESKGEIMSQNDVLKKYIDYVFDFISPSEIKPLHIVADAGNGMNGKILPVLFENLSCRVTSMYFDLDGSFPNHTPDPLVKSNLYDLEKKVKEQKADLGVAFDGDGDRIFFIDENSQVIDSSYVIALFSEYFLEQNSCEAIVYNAVCSKIVPEVINRYSGEAIQEKVGHTFMKKSMKDNNAVFGGEHSGHYYFRHNFSADSSILSLLLMLKIISQKQKKLSDLVKPFQKYFRIDEANFEVSDKEKILQKVKDIYKKGEVSLLDGLTVSFSDWWFNLRPSNTESFLRLNIEAGNKKILEEKFKELKGIIKKHS